MSISKPKNSDLAFFTSVVWNGLLGNRHVILIFILILFSLFCSCVFEAYADDHFSNLSKTLEKGTEDSPIFSYVLFYTLHLLFGWIHNHLFYTNIHFLKSVLYRYLMKMYLNCHPKSFDNVGTGKICSIIHKQVDSLIFLLKNVFLRLVYNLAYISLFIIRLYKDKKLELSTKIVFVSLLAFVALFICYNCHIAYIYKKRLIDVEHTNSHALLDIFKNMTVVKAFNNESFEISKFNSLMGDQISFGYTFYFFESLFMVCFKILLLIGLLVPIHIANLDANNPFINPHAIYQFFVTFNSFKRKISGLKDCIYKVFDKFIDTSASSTINVILVDKIRKTELITGQTLDISFENTAIYLDGKLIFDHFSLEIPFGTKIAITGRNGAGKSTIIKALLGLIDYNGEMLIDGKSIRKIDEKTLHDAISYVPQEPHLFNTTVMDNLKYGKNISDEEVVQKCIECGVHSIFKNLEKGYLTIVGESAKNISGGQAQIINFMRAIIKDAPIFLLDEPTSNLDYSTSNFIVSTVFNILKDKTVFLSTHNPQHLLKFDKILNINEKKIRVYNGYKEFAADPKYEFKL
ncbi:uncharacterized protein VICG_00030 [Vittaforma corneae ATCC 50505]|uniref:ABC transporter domain-containing protein n=1 Tax=Vittaforma corneae (strain ATCC 50505) TaxID=993615 RepID=L2GQD8_VITCO|nr:uncharacterized protein VICG_00030 [Vittaforma corneae ATCC 50505]ELA42715.1 hypothetical protein VICG_00030 [Vittaforma corneae ATCC 50505]